MNIRELDLIRECTFNTSRSGGKGGQNVNKVETKVELYFDIQASALLTDTRKNRLIKKLSNKLNKEGVLRLVCASERSQLANKKLVSNKLFDTLEKALKRRKKRKATKPSKAAVQRRLTTKKKLSEKKKRTRSELKKNNTEERAFTTGETPERIIERI